MSWNWVNDSIQALNSIGAYLSSIPQEILVNLINLMTLIIYPFYEAVYLLLQDFQIIYDTFSGFANIVINISNIPTEILGTIFPLPPIWTVLLLASVSISAAIRLYRWIKEGKGWVPTLSGD